MAARPAARARPRRPTTRRWRPSRPVPSCPAACCRRCSGSAGCGTPRSCWTAGTRLSPWRGCCVLVVLAAAGVGVLFRRDRRSRDGACRPGRHRSVARAAGRRPGHSATRWSGWWPRCREPACCATARSTSRSSYPSRRCWLPAARSGWQAGCPIARPRASCSPGSSCCRSRSCPTSPGEQAAAWTRCPIPAPGPRSGSRGSRTSGRRPAAAALGIVPVLPVERTRRAVLGPGPAVLPAGRPGRRPARGRRHRAGPGGVGVGRSHRRLAAPAGSRRLPPATRRPPGPGPAGQPVATPVDGVVEVSRSRGWRCPGCPAGCVRWRRVAAVRREGARRAGRPRGGGDLLAAGRSIAVRTDAARAEGTPSRWRRCYAQPVYRRERRVDVPARRCRGGRQSWPAPRCRHRLRPRPSASRPRTRSTSRSSSTASAEPHGLTRRPGRPRTAAPSRPTSTPRRRCAPADRAGRRSSASPAAARDRLLQAGARRPTSRPVNPSWTDSVTPPADRYGDGGTPCRAASMRPGPSPPSARATCTHDADITRACGLGHVAVQVHPVDDAPLGRVLRIASSQYPCPTTSRWTSAARQGPRRRRQRARSCLCGTRPPTTLSRGPAAGGESAKPHASVPLCTRSIRRDRKTERHQVPSGRLRHGDVAAAAVDPRRDAGLQPPADRAASGPTATGQTSRWTWCTRTTTGRRVDQRLQNGTPFWTSTTTSYRCRSRCSRPCRYTDSRPPTCSTRNRPRSDQPRWTSCAAQRRVTSQPWSAEPPGHALDVPLGAAALGVSDIPPVHDQDATAAGAARSRSCLCSGPSAEAAARTVTVRQCHRPLPRTCDGRSTCSGLSGSSSPIRTGSTGCSPRTRSARSADSSTWPAARCSTWAVAGLLRRAPSAPRGAIPAVDADVGELAGPRGHPQAGTVSGSGMELPVRDGVRRRLLLLQRPGARPGPAADGRRDGPGDPSRRPRLPVVHVVVRARRWARDVAMALPRRWVRAARRYERGAAIEPKNVYGRSLFPVRAAEALDLRWARPQRRSVVAALPRYHPRWAHWVVGVARRSRGCCAGTSRRAPEAMSGAAVTGHGPSTR